MAYKVSFPGPANLFSLTVSCFSIPICYITVTLVIFLPTGFDKFPLRTFEVSISSVWNPFSLIRSWLPLHIFRFHVNFYFRREALPHHPTQRRSTLSL